MVDAPEITPPLRQFCKAARPMASRSTPGCWKKRLSSTATVACQQAAGICSKVSGTLLAPVADGLEEQVAVAVVEQRAGPGRVEICQRRRGQIGEERPARCQAGGCQNQQYDKCGAQPFLG